MIAFNLLDDDWNFDFLLYYRTGRYDFNSDDLVTTLNVNKIVVLLSSCVIELLLLLLLFVLLFDT
jgi:hypothetical protein